MLGLGTFIFFDSLLRSLLHFFFFYAEEFWNRGLMWAP